MDPIAALLDRIPLKARETTMIAAPLFHSWGFAHWSLGISLSSTIVLKRKFDPEATLAELEALYHDGGTYYELVDEEGTEIAAFDTEQEAWDAFEKHDNAFDVRQVG